MVRQRGIILIKKKTQLISQFRKKTPIYSIPMRQKQIKPCMTTNTTCVLCTTDYLIISIHNKNKNNGETERNYVGREKTTT